MSISQEALQEMLSRNSGAVLCDLLTVDHEDMDQPVRLVRDNLDLEYNGDTYIACAFDATYPADEKDNVQPRAKITVDNVDLRLIDEIRSLTSSPTFTLEAVLRMPDGSVRQIIAPRTYDTSEFRYDQHVIEAQLGYEDLLNMPATSGRFDPVTASGLY